MSKTQPPLQNILYMVAKRIHCRNFNDPRYGQVVERGDTISFPHLPNKEIELFGHIHDWLKNEFIQIVPYKHDDILIE